MAPSPTFVQAAVDAIKRAAVAEYLAERNEKLVRARADKARKGHWVAGGSIPYGYHKDDYGRLVIDISERNALRMAADVILAGGDLDDAAYLLNQHGFKPRRADRWTKNNLYLRLINPTLRGDRVQRVGGETFTIPVPPLLDSHTADTLAGILRVRRHRKTMYGAPYPLSGIVFGMCGCRYNGVFQSGRDRRVYRCSGKHRGVDCSDRQVSADLLESGILRVLSLRV